MAHNPRYGNWSPDQWRDVAPTVADLRSHGFPVFARCETCGLEMDVRLETVARVKGPDYVLWGKSAPCRRRHCQGRMWFWCLPPRAQGAVEMF